MSSFNQNVIKHKTGLLNFAAELGNISKACRMMGFSRDTFYRYQAARDAGGLETLFEVSRQKPDLKNRGDEQTENAFVNLPWIFLLMNSSEPATNCAGKAFLFLRLACVPFGCVMIWLQ